VEQSILAEAARDVRVIPHGVDLDTFGPGDAGAARRHLAIPPDAAVLLCSGRGGHKSPWRDLRTVEIAVETAAERLPGRRLILICLGRRAARQRLGQAEAWHVNHQTDPAMVARYCQAADLYVHSARADTFPNSVLEALGCGTPVIATDLGGIPEQVKDMAAGGAGDATGLLVPAADPRAMAEAIVRLLGDEHLRRRLGDNARRDAVQRFDLDRLVGDYLDWYAQILAGARAAPLT
jgi:glycosyltransferase involved in cell wall biosynthesis